MPRHVYTSREYADIHLIYGECHCVATAAAALYHERYPNRHPPDYRVFINVHRAYSEGRIPGRISSEGRPSARSGVDEQVLDVINNFGAMTEKPKRPMSAYLMWLNSARDEIKKDNPGLRVTEVAKKGGEIWRSMEDKSEWETKAAKAKEQYAKDLESFNANGGEAVATKKPVKRTRKSNKAAAKRRARDDDDDEDDDASD